MKALEEESTILLSSNDGSSNESTSGSEDDKDDGEVLEGEGVVDVPGVEDQDVEGATSEEAPSGQVTSVVD